MSNLTAKHLDEIASKLCGPKRPLMLAMTPRCRAPLVCPFKAGTFCDRTECAIEDDTVCLPQSVTAHERNLRSLGCVVSGRRPVTLHHIRGGTVATTLFGTPGVGQKQNDALQIPLEETWHTGKFGIDAQVASGVESWERRWGSQVLYLHSISYNLRYSPWALAWRWASPIVRVRVERFLQESRSRLHPA